MLCNEMVSPAQTDTLRVPTGLTESSGVITISFARSSLVDFNHKAIIAAKYT